MAPPIRIYTTQQCWYCTRAKALFRKDGLDFEEIDVSRDQEIRSWLVEASGGRRTVPVIFIGETCVGGHDELVAARQDGTLERLLASS
jgi:glutaredoxin 3